MHCCTMLSLLLFLLCSSVPVYTTTSGSLFVGSFNIQIFGQSKVSKPGVLDSIVQIVKRYDIVLVQEIRDKKSTAIDMLMEKLNQEFEGDKFTLTIGSRQGRSNSKEQYAYLYRQDKVRLLDSLEYNDVGDKFERDPYIAKFQSIHGGIPEFTMIGIHTSPKVAEKEIDSLVEVYKFAVEKFGTEEVIIAGDFNADCTYVNKGEWPEVRLKNDPKFHWLIDNEADTTVSKTDCAYDRFVVTNDAFVKSISDVNVYRFDTAMGLDNKDAKVVSDHYPIELRINPSLDMEDLIQIKSTIEIKGKHSSSDVIKKLLSLDTVTSGVSLDHRSLDISSTITMTPCDLEQLAEVHVITKAVAHHLQDKVKMCSVKSSLFTPFEFRADFDLEDD